MKINENETIILTYIFKVQKFQIFTLPCLHNEDIDRPVLKLLLQSGVIYLKQTHTLLTVMIVIKIKMRSYLVIVAML
jgi:hypothetical protein